MSLSIDDTGVRPVMGEDPIKAVYCIMEMLNMEYLYHLTKFKPFDFIVLFDFSNSSC